MPKIVDHEERKRDIMEMALSIFIKTREKFHYLPRLSTTVKKCEFAG